jgi:ribose/xylose/arabinose/galactoside ABC-type transport system permease subunit
MGKFIRQLLPFGSLMLIVCILAAMRPDTFLTFDNFLNVLRRSSVYGIVAIGMTFVIISGGIDLSVGSMLAVCGMIGAWVMAASGTVAGTIAGVTAGLISGLVNGLLITKFRLQPFIVTLGTMSFFRGVALVMKDGQPINVPDYKYLGEGVIAGAPAITPSPRYL